MSHQSNKLNTFRPELVEGCLLQQVLRQAQHERYVIKNGDSK
jgi:hypothetical protein